jgi:hypothetical protein
MHDIRKLMSITEGFNNEYKVSPIEKIQDIRRKSKIDNIKLEKNKYYFDKDSDIVWKIIDDPNLFDSSFNEVVSIVKKSGKFEYEVKGTLRKYNELSNRDFSIVIEFESIVPEEGLINILRSNLDIKIKSLPYAIYDNEVLKVNKGKN